jgi:hypothetical protein
MKRTFIQSSNVERILRDENVTDDDLRQVEVAIMNGAGVTVSGTGGLKKIRSGAASKGKSGSVRGLFADYPRLGRVYMLAAFAKREQANVSAAERNALKKIKQTLDERLEQYVRGAK